MQHYEKTLTKIKKPVEWDSNHQPDAYSLMAARPLRTPVAVDEWWAL